MKNKTNLSPTRRQWLTAAARWASLAGAAAVWTHLMRRRPNGETACIDLRGMTGCRQCGQLSDCGLPRALSVKQFLKNADHEQRKS